MSVIQKIAYFLGERSEVPNQVLAKELAASENLTDIQEVASYLYNENQSIASDCIKVLYEIGYLKPELITGYTNDFIQLLDNENNRMIWGAMIALSTIAPLVPEKIHPHLSKVRHQIEIGSVITNVAGVRTLIQIAGTGEGYYKELIDELLQLLRDCRNTDFAKRAEDLSTVVQEDKATEFGLILNSRLPHLSKNAQQRVERVIKRLGHICQ
jgi:hypothetical protein